MSKEQLLTIGFSLTTPFSKIKDPRINRKKEHNLLDILLITVMGTLCGADNFVAIVDWAKVNEQWLSTFLELKNGIASHDTFCRVFALLTPEEYQNAFKEWVDGIKNEVSQKEIIAIDGKYLRGSRSIRGKSTSAIIMINAWATEAGLSLAQITSRLKKGEGEKRGMEKIIDSLDVSNKLLTFDAGGATTTIFNKVVKAEGDVLIGLKNNQRNLLKLTTFLYDEPKNQELIKSSSTEEKSHGRIEKRRYEVIPFKESYAPASFSKLKKKQHEKWEYLKSLVRVTRERTDVSSGVATTNIDYYITSLDCDDLQYIVRGVRNHWHVENKLHYQLDVTFREDHSQVKIGHAPENMAVLRQMALNLLKGVDPKISMNRKRMLCAWDKRYLLKILFGLDEIKII